MASTINDTERAEFYLAKAKEAEETAAKTRGMEEKKKLLEIAGGYRHLAVYHGKHANP